MIKKSTKNMFIIVFTLVYLLCFISIPAGAYSAAIDSIDIDILLNDQGTAYITEVWDVTVADGTEWYLVQANLGDIQIKDFSVSDETGKVYSYQETWDVKASIDEKAGKCGIVTKSSGYELCWGVGSYGPHTFTVSYTMTNFVKGYTDANGFNNRVINNELTSTPRSINVEIEKEGTFLDTNNTKIWAFGFDGKINVIDGKIVAQSNNMTNSSYVNVMAKFEPGLFNPTSTNNHSFSKIEDRAKIGSDYNTGYTSKQKVPVMTIIIIFSASFLFMFFIIFILYSAMASSKHYATPHTKKMYKQKYGFKSYYKLQTQVGNSCTEVPFYGDIPQTIRALTHLGYNFNNDKILSAFFTNWMNKKLITMQKYNKKGIFSTNNPLTVITFSQNYGILPPIEQELYSIFFNITDSNNNLREDKIANYASQIQKNVRIWKERMLDAGTNSLLSNGYMVPKSRTEKFATKKPTHVLTDSGYNKCCEAFSFINYIDSINEQHLQQGQSVEYWGDYLVFASLFGQCEQLLGIIENYDPLYFSHYGYYDLWMFHSITHFSSTCGQAASYGDTSSSGGGGSSSFGGGGGFSGGGSGGGSR